MSVIVEVERKVSRDKKINGIRETEGKKGEKKKEERGEKPT